jgi:hypothetical protein
VSGFSLAGLSPARSARSLRAQPDGEVLITDGPYLETTEHMGGFRVRKPLIWRMRLRGGVRLPSPVGCRRGAPGLEAQRRQLSGSDNTAGDAGLTSGVGVPRAGQHPCIQVA